MFDANADMVRTTHRTPSPLERSVVRKS